MPMLGERRNDGRTLPSVHEVGVDVLHLVLERCQALEDVAVVVHAPETLFAPGVAPLSRCAGSLVQAARPQRR